MGTLSLKNEKSIASARRRLNERYVRDAATRVDVRPDKIKNAKPAKGWSHHDDLKEAYGKKILLRFPEFHRGSFSERTVEGILICADQFSLKVSLKMSNGECTRVFFKSAMNSFEILEG